MNYDAAGRITSRVNGAGTTSYTFDDRGLMTHATMADGTNIAYSYDALGNRRAKTVNGETTHYLTAPIFGMSHVLAELAPDNTIKSTYIYAGPKLLKEEPSTSDRSLDLYMLHEGKVGSITHTIDMNGSVRNEYDYDTFGTRTHVKTASTGSNQHFGYTGEMQDPESGLLYLRARYYDPAIGRFISADPYLGRMAEPVTQNRYIYVHNNPLLYTDPSGLAAGDWWDYSESKKRAGEIGNELLSDSRFGGLNDLSDARRHSEWNRRMTEELGAGWALAFGVGHELYDNAYEDQYRANKPIEWAEIGMDLHNNVSGIVDGLSGSGNAGLNEGLDGLIILNNGTYQYNNIAQPFCD